MKYEDPTIREQKRLEAVKRQSDNAKRSYYVRKANEKPQSVEEWFKQSQAHIHAHKDVQSPQPKEK